MKTLSKEIIRFFERQPFSVITTIDAKGYPHNSCKGIINIRKKGQVCLLDLYKEKTYENLKQNPHVSITAVDEHKFIGYSLKGKARIVKRERLRFRSKLMKLWENRIIKRISHRLLKNIRGEKGHSKHPEALLPMPEYRIVVEVREIVDLTPHHIKNANA